MTLVKYNAAGELLQDEARFAPNSLVCSAYLSTATGAASGVRKVPYNATRFDPFGSFDPVNSRFQPKVPGYYRLSALVDVGAAGGYAFSQWWRNGSFYAYGGYFSSVGAETMLPDSIVVYLNGSTDYIEVYAGTSSAVPVYANSRFDAELVAASVGVAPEPRHLIGATGEPAFTNGWAAEGVGTYQRPHFLKDPHGIVHVAGSFTGASATGAVAFTLPVGYRPDGAILTALPFFPGGATPKGVGEASILGTTGAVNLFNGNEAFQANMRYAYFETHYLAAS